MNTAVSQQTSARVRLRPTMQSDLTYVLSLEQDEHNLPFITPWDRTQHEAAIRFPDMRHFIIEGGDGLEPVGFLILVGCRSQHQSLELKRMVVQGKGAGFGRAALRVAKRVVFDDLKAHRFWLDVKQSNVRAQAFYASEGFTVEGVLREAVKVRLSQGQPGFDSLVVLSMLQTEYTQRHGAGLELRA